MSHIMWRSIIYIRIKPYAVLKELEAHSNYISEAHQDQVSTKSITIRTLDGRVSHRLQYYQTYAFGAQVFSRNAVAKPLIRISRSQPILNQCCSENIVEVGQPSNNIINMRSYQDLFTGRGPNQPGWNLAFKQVFKNKRSLMNNQHTLDKDLLFSGV